MLNIILYIYFNQNFSREVDQTTEQVWSRGLLLSYKFH